MKHGIKEALLTLIWTVFCVWVGAYMGWSSRDIRAIDERAMFDLCPEHTKLVAEGHGPLFGRIDRQGNDSMYVWQICEEAP